MYIDTRKVSIITEGKEKLKRVTQNLEKFQNPCDEISIYVWEVSPNPNHHLRNYEIKYIVFKHVFILYNIFNRHVVIIR